MVLFFQEKLVHVLIKPGYINLTHINEMETVVKIRQLCVCILLLTSIQLAIADPANTVKADRGDMRDHMNYSLGVQIGEDLKRQKLELDKKEFLQGLNDALGDTKPKMDKAEMEALLVTFKKHILSAAEKYAARKKQLDLVVQENREYLVRNLNKEGVKVTDSGLQYRILKPGTGKQPGPTDQVTINFRGKRIDGSIFDSSDRQGHPRKLFVNKTIKGLKEGLQMMKEGGKWEFVIPSSLAYTRSDLMKHRTVIFEIELISVSKGNVATN